MSRVFFRNRDQFWWQVFEKPYTRVAPFVLGLGLGFVLIRLKDHCKVSKVGHGVTCPSVLKDAARWVTGSLVHPC